MTTKELVEEANKLLNSNWDDTEKELVKKMVDSLVYYKAIIPKSIKGDIKIMLQIANRIKAEYDLLLIKYNTECGNKQTETKEENKTKEENDEEEKQKENKDTDIEIIN